MQDVLNYIDSLVSNNDKIVVAVSGGPDSMYLLDVLLKVRKSKTFDIVVAHVNHNVRLESYDEANKVEEYCKNNNMIFEYMIIDKYGTDNFHDYARTVRYKFFESLVSKYKAKYLLTAHHGDDLMETILMRIVRGSTVSGYTGFSRETKLGNYSIIRPLITMTKQEIEEYMNKNNLWYAVDMSNKKDVYTRNRYRKYILPKLKEENKNVHKKFLKFSEKIKDVSDFFNKYANGRYNEIVVKDKLDLGLLLKEDKVVIESILSKYLYKYYKDNIYMITDKNMSSIYNCILSNKSNLLIDIPGNFKFVKSYNNAYIVTDDKKESYKYEIKSSVYINGYGVIKKVDDSTKTDNYVTYLDSSKIKLPLYVRNRKKGDKMVIKNMDEAKKIKNIFIDSKVPIDKRDDYPIVVDSNDEIIWLPGLKKSKFDSKNSGKYDIILLCEL